LGSVQGMGRKTLDEILEKVRESGLTLAETPVSEPMQILQQMEKLMAQLKEALMEKGKS
jgi:hypothetical protein